MIVGYGRVSTDGQSLESQLAALKAAGAEKVFAEKISGAKTDRKALAGAIKCLGLSDVLLVTRLDRLGGSTREPPERLRSGRVSWRRFQIAGRSND
jgi:DNA invertase Pin-like site-specific DNA recombinase